MSSGLSLLGSKLCTSVLEFSCPASIAYATKESEVSIRNTKSIMQEGSGVWVGQLFSSQVAPLAERKVEGSGPTVVIAIR